MPNPRTGTSDAIFSERIGHAASLDLIAQRSAIDAAVRSGLWQCDAVPAERRIAGVRCLDFTPPGEPRATILHLHGGGFRLGCPEQIAPFAAALASRCQVNVVCPAYRLAPEHPFPAALVDGWSVLSALMTDDGPLILSGDSAGGGLAAGLAALASQALGLRHAAAAAAAGCRAAGAAAGCRNDAQGRAHGAATTATGAGGRVVPIVTPQFVWHPSPACPPSQGISTVSRASGSVSG